MTFALLVKAMIDGTMTCRELAEYTGLHYLTVLHYTKAMHKAGAAHVAAWENDSVGRCSIRVYRLGPGKDAKKPTRTRAQVCADRRARKRDAEFLGLKT
jgi:hypothetical protein